MRVLVVEDEDALADFIIRGLTEEGMNVERAATGAEAGFSLSHDDWDVVLLDWRLPGKDGLSLLQEFRRKNTDTPVLFLTARDTVDDRVTGLDSGADDYLCKPFDFSELVARVRALTRRQDGRPGTVLSYADIRLDLATHKCERNNHTLDLKAKEQSLLALFLRYPERVLSRTRIYETVWDEQFVGLSNTLEVHVSELRRKLEAHGPRVIHTLRGRGYRLGPVEDAESVS